jgi:hypothetical protein
MKHPLKVEVTRPFTIQTERKYLGTDGVEESGKPEAERHEAYLGIFRLTGSTQDPFMFFTPQEAAWLAKRPKAFAEEEG